MTITARRSDQTAPSNGPDGSAVLVAAGVGSESVNTALHAQQNLVVEAQVLPASDTHTATGFGALSDITDDFVRLADVLATLTAANHSQGPAATIEALRPEELLPPEVQYPWTEPHTLTTPRLPAALRRIPTHAIQLKRRLARRHAPKANFLVFFLLFVSILVVFARITSDQRTPFNYLLSVVWSVYAPLIVLGLIGALSLRRQQRRGRRSAGEDASDVPMTSATEVKPPSWAQQAPPVRIYGSVQSSPRRDSALAVGEGQPACARACPPFAPPQPSGVFRPVPCGRDHGGGRRRATAAGLDQAVRTDGRAHPYRERARPTTPRPRALASKHELNQFAMESRRAAGGEHRSLLRVPPGRLHPHRPRHGRLRWPSSSSSTAIASIWPKAS